MNSLALYPLVFWKKIFFCFELIWKVVIYWAPPNSNIWLYELGTLEKSQSLGTKIPERKIGRVFIIRALVWSKKNFVLGESLWLMAALFRGKWLSWIWVERLFLVTLTIENINPWSLANKFLQGPGQTWTALPSWTEQTALALCRVWSWTTEVWFDFADVCELDLRHYVQNDIQMKEYKTEKTSNMPCFLFTKQTRETHGVCFGETESCVAQSRSGKRLIGKGSLHW